MLKNTLLRRFPIAMAGTLIGLLTPLAQVSSSSSSSPMKLNACWAGIACVKPGPLFQRVNNAFFAVAGAIALSIFLVGAFMMVISAGNDTLLQSGKRAMKGSLIGIALVTGAYGVYRTVVFWLYP